MMLGFAPVACELSDTISMNGKMYRYVKVQKRLRIRLT